MAIWVVEYDGVPPAEIFSSAQGRGTPIVVDKNTGFAYYYKSGVGVQIIDSPAGGGIADHGSLTGLSDDDHPQYHNNARGDARYAGISHIGSGGSAHALVTTSTAGFMSAADKMKLDSLEDWTYVFLSMDETVSSSTPATTALSFTPDASSQYLIEGVLILSTDTPSNPPAAGVSWPSSLTAGAASLTLKEDTTETAEFFGKTSAADFTVSPSSYTGNPLIVEFQTSLLTSGSTSGDFTLTVATAL